MIREPEMFPINDSAKNRNDVDSMESIMDAYILVNLAYFRVILVTNISLSLMISSFYDVQSMLKNGLNVAVLTDETWLFIKNTSDVPSHLIQVKKSWKPELTQGSFNTKDCNISDLMLKV